MILSIRHRAVVAGASIFTAIVGSLGCHGAAREHSPAAIRLVDLYRPEAVAHRVPDAAAPPRTEWRFDGAPPAGIEPAAHAATRGWQAGLGVAELAIRDGRLVGRTTTDLPLVAIERTTGLDDPEPVDAVEIRLSVSAGSQLAVRGDADPKLDLAKVAARARDFPWRTTAALAPGGAPQTVTIRPPRPITGSEVRHLVLRPTDVAGARFAIESVRLVFRRERLAALPAGVSWQGLAQIYRETLVARAPETLRFDLDVPPRAWLDLGVGTVDPAPVTFRVTARAAGAARSTPLLARTVTTAEHWEPAAVDLAALAGRHVELELTLVSEHAGAVGLWGSPVVRVHAAPPPTEIAAHDPPQGVIVIWSDTTRRDHLGIYGYARDTTPNLRRMAAEGTLFDDCVAQASWTKVATPSFLTSLYPTTHGVRDFADRIPSSAETLAEVYRRAGYATLSFSSILFTGQFTNLHQGFEELHEDTSLPDQESSKTARIYVDRLLPWLAAHRDVPFFVFLHVSDPHDPFEPSPPWNTLWNDPARKAEHERQTKAAVAKIREPLLKQFGMPSRADLVAAGVDADAYNTYNEGWYDGSIRGMDAEIGRLRERLEELGLAGRTLVVYTGDHGEEFLEHGSSFHGQSLYGELTGVPLLMWRPGAIPAGRVVRQTVQTIDIMPTLLGLSGLPVPSAAQGESFLPLLSPAIPVQTAGVAGSETSADLAPVGWRQRPAFAERNATHDVGSPPPHDYQAFEVVDGGWKLVHNVSGRGTRPEFELFRHDVDRLDAHDVARQHPEIVQRLAAELAAWRRATLAHRLPADGEAQKSLRPEEVERLRSLGYLR